MGRYTNAAPANISMKMLRLHRLDRGNLKVDAGCACHGGNRTHPVQPQILRSPSGLPDLFDPKQREPVAHSFPSSNCNSLGGVVSEFGVQWVRLAYQQVDLTVFTF
jgi:hypothetical protein